MRLKVYCRRFSLLYNKKSLSMYAAFGNYAQNRAPPCIDDDYSLQLDECLVSNDLVIQSRKGNHYDK